MTPRAKKQLAAAAALIMAGAGVGFLALGNLEKNLVYYLTPSDLLARPDAVNTTVRLGGMVQQGSLQWDADTLKLRFNLGEGQDASAAHVPVVSTGAPPQMFREGIGCVVEGRFDGKVFHTDRLMVKHSNEYHPPEAGEDPRQLYKTMEAPARAEPAL